MLVVGGDIPDGLVEPTTVQRPATDRWRSTAPSSEAVLVARPHVVGGYVLTHPSDGGVNTPFDPLVPNRIDLIARPFFDGEQGRRPWHV